MQSTDILLFIHNLMRWVVLLTGIIVLLRTVRGLGGRRAFTTGDRKSALFFMISCDIQLLLGLALYFMRGWGNVWGGEGGMGGVMKSAPTRFWAMEHMLGMIVAIILVHIGYSSAKRDMAEGKKFNRVFWFSLIAIILMLATIPWPGREGVGRPLLRLMGADV